jgi:hypothetical protein
VAGATDLVGGGGDGVTGRRYEFDGGCHICEAKRVLNDIVFMYFNFILVIYVKKKYKLLPNAAALAY